MKLLSDLLYQKKFVNKSQEFKVPIRLVFTAKVLVHPINLTHGNVAIDIDTAYFKCLYDLMIKYIIRKNSLL